MEAVVGFVTIPTWLPLTIVSFSLLLIYGYYPMDVWRKLGVPGPPPLPFIGNMNKFLNPRIGIKGSVMEWQAKYGTVFGIYYFRKPCLVITDPRLYSDIFIKDFGTFTDRFMLGEHFIPEAMARGISFQKGEDWKRIRAIMTPVFTTTKLKSLTGYINGTAKNLALKIRKSAQSGETILAKEVFCAFSLDVIAGVGFGLDVDSQSGKNPELLKQTMAVFTIKKSLKLAMAIVGIFPFTGYLFQKLGLSIFNPGSIDYFVRILKDLVDERRHSDRKKRTDFLQYLLDSEVDREAEVNPGNRKLSPEETVYQGLMLLVGGYETTSTTMEFVAYLLAQHEDVQQKVRKEIESVTSGGESDEVTYEHCQQLKYLEAVIFESMRLYPVLTLLKREASKDTSLNGFKIPKNAGIMVTPEAVYRNPDLFPDPDKFQPERFLGDGVVNQFPFHPFGQGPRQCIGYRLAMIEVKIGIVHILRNVILKGAYPSKVRVLDYTGLLTPKETISFTAAPL